LDAAPIASIEPAVVTTSALQLRPHAYRPWLPRATRTMGDCRILRRHDAIGQRFS
jgi:hypothetical protein